MNRVKGQRRWGRVLVGALLGWSLILGNSWAVGGTSALGLGAGMGSSASGGATATGDGSGSSVMPGPDLGGGTNTTGNADVGSGLGPSNGNADAGAGLGPTNGEAAGGVTGPNVISNVSEGANGAAALSASGPSQGGRAAALARLQQGTQSKRTQTTEFQRFIQLTTGKLLPRFGDDFFQGGNVAANSAMPVDKDYPLGPGDEVLIRGWGSIDLNVRAVVDRNGLVNIPKVGSVSLAGVKAGDAEGVLKQAIGQVFRDFQLSVTLGQLRGINIFVVGQAVRPGTYKLSSASTLVTALFESGGPNPYGSMRHVQVKRDGKLLVEIDLYHFFLRGDKSADLHLIDGDVVVIPPALGYVALSGEVKTPAIYEIKEGGEPLSDFLDMAAGMHMMADRAKVSLEHFDVNQEKPRRVEQFALDNAGLGHPMALGDLVIVHSVVPRFANAVTLRGYKRVPFTPGMRVSDLIPTRDYLVADQVALTRNGAVNDSKVTAVGQFYPDMNWAYAVVERFDSQTLQTRLLPFNLGHAIDDPQSADNLPLQAGDTVSVFKATDVRIPIARRQVFVRVEGEVLRPGVYQVDQGEHLMDVIARAGGPTRNAYLFGSQFYRTSVQRSQQENYERFIQKLEQQITASSSKAVAAASASTDPNSAQARTAASLQAQQAFLTRMKGLKSTGRMSLGLPIEGATLAQFPDIRLENGDRLVIPDRPDFVQVFGSVNTESALLWHPHRSVGDYLSKAGVSRDAAPDDIFVLRPDGTVLANSDSWFSISIDHSDVVPGDIIVVPEKLDQLTGVAAFLNGAKDWTTILFNFALGAGALKAMGY